MEKGEGNRKPWAYSSLLSAFCFPQNSGNCCLVCFPKGKNHKAAPGKKHLTWTSLASCWGAQIHARKAQESVRSVRSHTACPGEKGKGQLDLESLSELSMGSWRQVGGLYFSIASWRTVFCHCKLEDFILPLLSVGVRHAQGLGHLRSADGRDGVWSSSGSQRANADLQLQGLILQSPFRHTDAEAICKRDPVSYNVVSKGTSITHRGFCL